MTNFWLIIPLRFLSDVIKLKLIVLFLGIDEVISNCWMSTVFREARADALASCQMNCTLYPTLYNCDRLWHNPLYE